MPPKSAKKPKPQDPVVQKTSRSGEGSGEEDNNADTTLYRRNDDYQKMYECSAAANVALLEEIKNLKEQFAAMLQANGPGSAANVQAESAGTSTPTNREYVVNPTYVDFRSPDQIPPLPPIATHKISHPPPQSHFRPNWEPRKLADLPAFTGAKGEWPSFINSFHATTQRYNYDRIENFTRLQKAIKGEALDWVRTLMIHDANVDLVITELEERYGQPAETTREYIKEIRAFPPIAPSRLVELINFSRDLNNIVGFIKAVPGGADRLNDQTLLEELIAKLPFNKREEWAAHYFGPLNRVATIESFSAWIRIQANCLRLARDTAPPKLEANRSKPICATVEEVSRTDERANPVTCLM